MYSIENVEEPVWESRAYGVVLELAGYTPNSIVRARCEPSSVSTSAVAECLPGEGFRISYR